MIPLFHNFKTHFEHLETYDQFDNWDCYKTLNMIFANRICRFIKEEVESKNFSPLVWINNQYFILTPRYLRKMLPS